MSKHLLTLLVGLLALSSSVFASADRQSFLGGGLGLQILAQNGSGTGFFIQGLGGYNFSEAFGVGLHGGYSNVGGMGIRTFDFGGFLQLTEGESGLYGKLYLDGINASVSGGGKRHGVSGTQTAFATGVGIGMLIPSAGDFHLVPEAMYRAAFFDSMVNVVNATFNLVWDL